MSAEERDVRGAQGELRAGRARDSGEGERIPCTDLQDSLPAPAGTAREDAEDGIVPGGGAVGGEVMDRRSAACANPRPDWRLSSFKRIVIKHVVVDCSSCCNKHCYTPNSAL